MFTLPAFFRERPQPELVAAVDLGSNSFHMIVARITQGQHIHVLDRLREMVRLGAGLDDNNYLSEASQQQALECLARFGQRLRNVDNVRIVGTNTLRMAKNANEFLEKAQATLGHPIEIIAGREEARLIYLGVAHALAATLEKRLVIDIGGGSTEFIIGEGFESLHRESLDIGCVNTSRRYFPEGIIRAKSLRRAEIAALLELQPLEELYLKEGWEAVIGASGTLRSVGRIISEMGWGDDITHEGLQKIRQALLDAGHIDNIELKGLSNKRKPVFVGGFAVISGIFEGLHIEKMTVSDGALREGLIYDILGRITHEDVRERTIQSLSTRYHVDVIQAERVEETALLFLTQVAQTWDLVNEEYAHMLSWAARLHEIGLSISHDQYHKHGEYLLNYSDLAGFTYPEQRLLATLVRAQRRKFPQVPCQQCNDNENNKIMRLCILLRLAILLHRSRSYSALPKIVLQTTDNNLTLHFPTDWLAQHPLTQTDLEQEYSYLKDINIDLGFE